MAPTTFGRQNTTRLICLTETIRYYSVFGTTWLSPRNPLDFRSPLAAEPRTAAIDLAVATNPDTPRSSSLDRFACRVAVCETTFGSLAFDLTPFEIRPQPRRDPHPTSRQDSTPIIQTISTPRWYGTEDPLSEGVTRAFVMDRLATVKGKWATLLSIGLPRPPLNGATNAGLVGRKTQAPEVRILLQSLCRLLRRRCSSCSRASRNRQLLFSSLPFFPLDVSVFEVARRGGGLLQTRIPPVNRKFSPSYSRQVSG